VSAVRRTLLFAGFTLLEYGRSGRVLVELAATAIYFYVFFRRLDGAPPSAEQFFTYNGIFTLALALYTTSTVLSLGDRPQGYVLLTRRLGRAGYLLGLYFAVLTIVLGAYGLVSLGCAIYNRPEGLTPGQWLLGSLPLALNVVIAAAALALLSSLVFAPGWRLVALGLLALAFSSNLLDRTFAQPLAAPLHTILAAPLLPAFAGFELAVTRQYSALSLALLLAQLLMALGLLALALYSFGRREIIFSRG
jgi:hypothetical protein